MTGQPDNEPILEFAPGSAERVALQEELDRQSAEVVEIPCIINGEEIFTGNTGLLYTFPSPRDATLARIPSSA